MGVLLTMALLLTLLPAPALAEEANASAAADEEAVDTRLAVDAVPEEPDETPAAPVDTAEALADAIAAAPADGTETVVTLTGDIAGLDRMLDIEAGQNIVLDLDGHAVTVTAGFAGRPLRNYGTLTVTGSGTIDSSASKTGGYGAVDNFGVLTIENGTFAGSVDASGAAVKNRPGGQVTIYGGIFTGATTALYNAGTARVYGGSFDVWSCSACNSKSWGYAIQSHEDAEGQPPELYFYDGTVTGVQGGFSSSAGYTEIHDGTFRTVPCAVHGGNSAFYALYIAGESGQVTCHVYGGTFTSASKVAVYVGNNTPGDGGDRQEALVCIHGGTFRPGSGRETLYVDGLLGSLEVSGGTFADDGVSDYLARACTAADNGDGTFTVLGPAARGEDGTMYASLAGAVAAAADGGTVTLLRDITEQIVLDSGMACTIDLNGHTLSREEEPIRLIHGSLTLTGRGTVTETAGDRLAAVTAYGSTDEADRDYSVLTVGRDVTLGGWAGVMVRQTGDKACGVRLEIHGTLKSPAEGTDVPGNALYVNGIIQNQVNYPVITLHETARVMASGESSTGIYGAGYAAWNVEGAAVTGGTGIELRAGSLRISGDAEVTGTSVPFSVLPNGNGTTVTGAGVAVAQHTTRLPVSVVITGGTIAGYTALYECNPQGNPPEAVAQVSLSVAGGSFRSINGGVNAVYSEDCTGFITGGHYTSAPNAYLAPGKVAVPSNQSGYAAMVTDAGGSTPAQVGGSAGNQTTNAVSDGSQAEQELADRVAEEISGGDTLVNSHQLTAAAGTVAGENAITPETTVAGQTVTEALDAAIPDTTVTAADVRIVIVPYLSVSVTNATVAQDGQKAFSLDISPMYITVATTADVQAGEDICLPQDPGQTNAMQIGDAMPLAVTEQVTVTIPLPAGFAGADEALYVHHRKGGVTYVYEGTVGAQGLTFENPHGFSPFTVTAVGAEAEVDGVRYASLQDALDTVADGGIVTVLASDLSARVSGDKRFSLMLADRVEAPALTAADGYELTQEGGIWTVCPVSQRPSGGASSGSAPRYAVALEQTEHGTVRVSPQQAAAGQTVTVTAVPDPGYAMDAVTVMRADGTEIPVQAVGGDGYIFSMPAGTVRVTVAFRLERAADPTAPDGWVNPYDDVAADAWYYGAAGYAAANGLMRGTTEHTFSPAGSMSRAMVWTVLARMDGQDVDGGQPWYQQAQDWAVAQGVSDGTAPAGAVTRGQLVAMLYRLAGSPAVTAQALEEMDSHPDSGGVGQWAQDAVAWALRLGILNGGSDGMLAPGRTITRAEAAAVLGRYHQMFS